MTIKNRGGVFGRNPTFNDVDVDGTLSIAGAAIPAPANTLVSSDIGSTVQGYDADTTKNDVSNTFTQNQIFNTNVGIGIDPPATQLHLSNNSGAVIRLENLETSSSTGLSMGKVEWRTGDASAAGVAGFIDVQDYNNFGTAFKMILGGGLSGSGVTGLEIDALGNATVPAGNLVIGTSGNGIDFSATAGTGTSELFDDYEEGTWSGAVTDGTNSASFTGYYTKIGNTVFVQGDASNIESAVTFSGNVYMSGLPYSSSQSSTISVLHNYMATANLFQGRTSGAEIRFYKIGGIGLDFVQMTESDVAYYTDLTISGSYLTS
jgi:hypothetical protein